MCNGDLPLLLLRRRAETMERQLPSPTPNSTEPSLESLQFELPSDLVHPDIANIASLAYGSAIRCRTAWDHRIRDQAGAERDVRPQLRATTYDMIMTLLSLEAPKPLPTDPLPPPTAPDRPPFMLEVPQEIDIEEYMKALEAVVYHFNIPESLLQLFSELGQLIWSNDWLRFFLIRNSYRRPVGPDMFYGVLRWWLCTDTMVIAAFLVQKMEPGLKAEVNHYIPAVQGIKTFQEWHEVWTMAIDEVSKVRRMLDAGVSMMFHAKLAEERAKIQKDTPPPTPSTRRTPRSSLDRDICAQLN
jgi:hypothetical protein